MFAFFENRTTNCDLLSIYAQFCLMFELLTSNVPKYLRVSMAKGGIAKGIFTAFFNCPSRQPKIIINIRYKHLLFLHLMSIILTFLN